MEKCENDKHGAKSFLVKESDAVYYMTFANFSDICDTVF